MLTRREREHNETLTGPDRVLFYTPEVADETKQLTTRDQLVRISNSKAAVVVLPPVSKAAGLTFTISVDSATAAITLTDFGGTSYNDSINWEGDYTLDAAEDTIALYSDGRTWHVVDNQIA